MKNQNTGRLSGFTLIELLVVVLIIGILAAVAVPQYQIAVEKSRAAEALVMLRAIAHANQIYYMANGVYADKISDLDVEVPGENTDYNRKRTKYFVYGSTHVDGTQALALTQRLPYDSQYAMWITIENPNEIVCKKYSTLGQTICKNLSGSTADTTQYIIK